MYIPPSPTSNRFRDKVLLEFDGVWSHFGCPADSPIANWKSRSWADRMVSVDHSISSWDRWRKFAWAIVLGAGCGMWGDGRSIRVPGNCLMLNMARKDADADWMRFGGEKGCAAPFFIIPSVKEEERNWVGRARVVVLCLTRKLRGSGWERLEVVVGRLRRT